MSLPLTASGKGAYDKPSSMPPLFTSSTGKGAYDKPSSMPLFTTSTRKPTRSMSHRKSKSRSPSPSRRRRPKIIPKTLPKENFVFDEWTKFFSTPSNLNGDPYEMFGISIYFVGNYDDIRIPNDIRKLLLIEALSYRYVDTCIGVGSKYVNSKLTYVSRDSYLMFAKCDENIIAFVRATRMNEYEYDISLICTSPSGFYTDTNVDGIELKWRIGYAMTLKLMSDLKRLYKDLKYFSLQPADFSLFSLYYKDGWRSLQVHPHREVHENDCPECYKISKKSLTAKDPKYADITIVGRKRVAQHIRKNETSDTLISMGMNSGALEGTIVQFIKNVTARLESQTSILKNAKKLKCFRKSNFGKWIDDYFSFFIKELLNLNIYNIKDKVIDFNMQAVNDLLNSDAYDNFQAMHNLYQNNIKMYTDIAALDKKDFYERWQSLHMLLMPLYICILYNIYFVWQLAWEEDTMNDGHVFPFESRVEDMFKFYKIIFQCIAVSPFFYRPQSIDELNLFVSEFSERFIVLYDEITEYINKP
jgi:hypothetical protein